MKRWMGAILLAAACGGSAEQSEPAQTEPALPPTTVGVVRVEVDVAEYDDLEPTTRHNPSTITRSEYNAIKIGMTHAEVAEIVGGRGDTITESNISGITGKVVQYFGADGISNAMLQFQNGEVILKSQFGL